MATDPEQISEFCTRFNLPLEAVEFLEALPGEVRAKVLCSFDPKGSKDGNVFPRLEAFANSILNPGSGKGGGRGKGGGWWPEQTNTQFQPVAPMQAAAPRHQLPAGSSMPQYCASIGLGEESTVLMQMLPADMQETIMADFNPQGTKDGNVFGRLIGFARSIWTHRISLDKDSGREAAVYLRELPENVQIRVMSQFDPMRSGGGPVLVRLQRFAMDLAHQAGMGGAGRPVGAAPQSAGSARWSAQGGGELGAWQPAVPRAPVGNSWSQAGQQPQWSNRSGTGAGSLDDFAQLIGLDTEAYNFLRALPEDVQAPIISGFDPSGTKDGNVWGRLFGFARSVWSHKLGLDASVVSMLKSFAEDVQRVVMMKFDPSLSKDGNIAARLEGFARSVAARGAYGKGDGGGKGHGSGGSFAPAGGNFAGGFTGGKGLQPPWQQQQAYPPASRPQQSFGGMPQQHGATPLRAFFERWNLNEEGVQFMEALPEQVASAVCQSFNASGTKDGNVWARLFGFVRSVWQRQLNIHGEAFTYLRSLSEDAQRLVMMRFDPASAASGDTTAELRSIYERYVVEGGGGGCGGGGGGGFGGGPWQEAGAGGWQGEHQQEGAPFTWQGAPAGQGPDEQAVLEFAQRFSLDEAGIAFLYALDSEVLQTVVTDFSAGGTKDGNVFGRLQGFANSVTARKRRRGPGGSDDAGYGRNVRARGGW